MRNHLLRILCLIIFSALYGCSGGSSEGGISGTGGPPKITVQGAAEKGPFLKRSEVTYKYIDSRGEPISEDSSTETTDNLGNFTLGLNEAGLLSIRVEGYHFNELNGQVSDGPLVLKAIFEASEDESQKAYVNILTHLISDRVLEIIQLGETSVNLAITQAEKELLTELDSAIPRIGINDFSQLSIYNRNNTNEQGNAYLLLLSAALYQHALNNSVDGSSQSGQLTKVLNDLADDFVDGDLEASSVILDGLVLAIQQLDPQGVITNLENRSSEVLGQQLEVADFSAFIGQFIITYPAIDAELSDMTVIRTEVPNGLKNVTLDFIVDGLVVDSITEAPYEFTWNPYYWSSESSSRHTLLVKARNSIGAEIISNLVPVSVLANNAVTITSPQNYSIFQSVDELEISWASLGDAASYEYQLNEGDITLTEEASTLVSLPVLGLYQAKIRATNAEGYTGGWSNIINFSLQPPEVTQITTPFYGQSFQNTNQINLQWEVIGSAEYYEYQLNDVAVVRTDQNQATIIDLDLGNHDIKVRSIDSLGFSSDWSDTTSFSLIAPSSPTISKTEITETDEAFELSVTIVNGLVTNEVQIATDSSFNSSSIVATQSAGTAHVDSELAAGVYYVRTRTINEFGHASAWSSRQEVPVGLFAHAINMNSTMGWNDNDLPVALVFDEGSFVVAATNGPLGDGSGDDFYVTKLNINGGKDWGVSLRDDARYPYPGSMRKTDSGYLLTAFGANRRDAILLELNEEGLLAWSETIVSETGLLDGTETYTREYIHDSIKVADDEYALLGKYNNYKVTGGNTDELIETKNKVTYLDRSGDIAVKTEYEFEQPASGEYKNINDLLFTDNRLYAAGEYKANGGSGAVLFEINKSDGSIIDENTRTASGLSYRHRGDVVQASEGDIYVSYEQNRAAAASVFHSTGQSMDLVTANGMDYAKLAADNDNNVYLVGRTISDSSSSLLVRYNNATEQTRLSLSKYSTQLTIKSLVYDEKYGLIVLATDRGNFYGLDTYDSYTVIFNITDTMQYLAPTKLVTDYGQ